MTRQKDDTPQLYYFYKLVCNDPSIKDLYVGCTVNWNDRKSMHKSTVNNKNNLGYNTLKAKIIRANGGWDSWSMLEIERGTYIRRMAEAHEFELMVKLNSTMNHQRCFNSHSKCEHDKEKRNCKQCKGSKICEHDKQKQACKQCKGSSICEHDYCNKQYCPYCSPWLCECGSWTVLGDLKKHYKSEKCKSFHMLHYGSTY
jgi:hypothetical protein